MARGQSRGREGMNLADLIISKTRLAACSLSIWSNQVRVEGHRHANVLVQITRGGNMKRISIVCAALFGVAGLFAVPSIAQETKQENKSTAGEAKVLPVTQAQLKQEN